MQIEDGLFIPVQELNNLRREGITELQKELLRIALEEKADRQGSGKGTDVTAKRGKNSMDSGNSIFLWRRRSN